MFSSKSILLLTVLATGSIAGSANDLLPRGNVQPMDLNMELEMNQEFDVVLPRAGETNFQTFTGALLSQTAEPVTANGGSDPTKPFTCSGNTFSDLKSALERSCNNQQNACSDAANKSKNKGVKVSDCQDQLTQCKAAGAGGLIDKSLVDGSAEQLVFC